jgi:pimeloyl-ACP methyl ester carboxylesterase
VSHPSHLTVIDSQSAPEGSAEFEHRFASGWREQWLALDGLRYCCRVLPHPRPAFEPTLFLSGAFQTMDSWARFARAFAHYSTVVLIDPPGLGRSDQLPAAVGVDFLADAIVAVLDLLHINRVNVVAASYGTPAAFRLAQRQPARVARIALAGTMKEIPAHVRERVRATIASANAGDRELLAEQVIDGLLCHDRGAVIARRAVAVRVLRAGLLKMSDDDLRRYAANTARLLDHQPLDVRQRIRGPRALVFTGEHDCFTPPEACLEIAAAFDEAVFTTVNAADHLLHIEQFEIVCALLLAFMHDTAAADVAGCAPLRYVRSLPRPMNRPSRYQTRECERMAF